MDKLREFLNSKTFFIIWAISTIPALIFKLLVMKFGWYDLYFAIQPWEGIVSYTATGLVILRFLINK
mgnify:FL=1